MQKPLLTQGAAHISVLRPAFKAGDDRLHATALRRPFRGCPTDPQMPLVISQGLGLRGVVVNRTSHPNHRHMDQKRARAVVNFTCQLDWAMGD